MTRDPQALTARQQEVRDFMAEYAATNGSYPTLHEIRDFMHCSSPTAALVHLDALERKGVITRGHDGAARCIRFTDPLVVLERQIKRLTKSQRAELRRRMG